MNEIDTIKIARHQLCDAISRYPTPANSSLNVSPWIAMSALQKAIRRGDEQLALRTASALLHVSMANSQILAQTDRPGQFGRGGAVPRPTGTGRTYANRSVIMNSPPTGVTRASAAR